MPAYFLESSAFVKRFAPERGSKFVLSLLGSLSRKSLLRSQNHGSRSYRGFDSEQRGKKISADQAVKGLRRLHRDFSARFTQIAIGEHVVVEALRLTKAYGLRGYDSIQLSAALEANSERIARGLLPLILVSADTELNNAAQTEGLVIEDPNNYP